MVEVSELGEGSGTEGSDISPRRQSRQYPDIKWSNRTSARTTHDQRQVTFEIEPSTFRSARHSEAGDFFPAWSALEGRDEAEIEQQEWQTRMRLNCDHSSSSDSDHEDLYIEDPDIEYDSDNLSSSHSHDQIVPLAERVALASNNLRNNTFNIIRSQFSNQEKDDDMCIELTCGQDCSSEREQGVRNAFRWIHLQDDIMDFDDFINNSLRAPGLSTPEKLMIKRKLNELQREHEKPLWTQLTMEGRRMGPFVDQKLWFQDSAAKSDLNRKILIMSIPFFLLDKYVGRFQTTSPTNHPPLTLLQYLSRTTPLEQDMKQAVCNLPMGRKDCCFYVSHMWCLILDDSLIITCSKLAENHLTGGTITLVKEPTRGSPYIKVTDGGNCIWQLGYNECKSWFGFTAHFMKISNSDSRSVCAFEDVFRVTMRGQEVTAENWSRMVASEAEERTVHLVLVRRTRTDRRPPKSNLASDDASIMSESVSLFPWQMEETPPPAGGYYEAPPLFEEELSKVPEHVAPILMRASSQPQNNGSSSKQQSTAASSLPQDKNSLMGEEAAADNISIITRVMQEHYAFHALSLSVLPGSEHEEPTGENIQETELEKIEEIVFHLELNVDKHVRDSYRACQSKMLPDVAKHLLDVTRISSSISGYEDALSVSDKFFVAAVGVFDFFLSLHNDSVIAKKYWGTIHFILKKYLMARNIPQTILEAITTFEQISRLALIIKNELSSPQGPGPDSLKTPKEFEAALLHCMTFLLLFRVKNMKHRRHMRHAKKFQKCLHNGREVLRRAVMKAPLQKKEMAPPLALLSILIKHIMIDGRKNGSQPDIAEVYLEYFQQLEGNITTRRLKKPNSEIVYLRQELRAVILALDLQLETLTSLRAKIEEQSVGWSFLHNRHLEQASRPETLVIQQCIEHVKGQSELIGRVSKDLTKLEKWVQERNESTKDKHDNAIYAFTIVTVIFLPLSFVCSFLGMNTAGIRDMEHGQWIFWVIAIPLTLIVILLALLWTEELRHTWKALSKLIPERRRRAGSGSLYERSPLRMRESRREPEKEEIVKGVFARKMALKAETLPTVVSSPPLEPLKRVPTTDVWEKPYRRTDTFKSTI
ncbi:hypothetical protein K505DRAFT_363097 [Melanomma pulvis-pyrius CBS 109.77]|uniref:Cora-domain-containing protein n=1 Tax=Melanomma pulvis-pyrius CBS 109.77 TaxID=1314802 RepID=A0A6A6X7K9_9PLEO|nr:hypothetical protein K505DRAFT_363097 [Melanomma pulvis-pyrius CBS 109.77]